jgi:hypothetical protein
MKITNEAKTIIEQLLKENGSDTLIVKIGVSSCCGGKSIQLDLGNAVDLPRISEINGVKVSMTEEDEKQLEKVVFSAEKSELIIQSDECGCGGEGGCCCH